MCGRLVHRRVFVVVTLLLSGCSDLFGEDDRETERLLLYAAPRQPPTDGQHLSNIGAEAVTQAGGSPSGRLCVRLTAQFGTFKSPTAGGPVVEVAADGGEAECPGPRCTFLTLPSGKLRREFTIYQSPTQPAPDIILGALYSLGESDRCPPSTLPDPVATSALTLQVPDVPLPVADMSASVPSPSTDGGTP